jgi:RNA polymerase sigma-70 factor, ECF subfamily
MAPAVAYRRVKTKTSYCRVADADAELMLRVRDDEPGAFAELTERFRARIFARLYRIVPDRQEAEDMTQDVFLRIYRSRRRYRPQARFTTWLYHVTQNVARNTLRRRRRHAWLRFGQLDLDETVGQERRGSNTGDSPSAALERRDLALAVRGAVAELAGRQRTALEMQQFQNRTYAEIADTLALSPEATKSLLYRARLQLRAFLAAIL